MASTVAVQLEDLLLGRSLLVCGLLLALVGCGGGKTAVTASALPGTPTTSAGTPMVRPSTVVATPMEIAPAALAYLDTALELMQSHALYADRVDWAGVRRSARQMASGARTPADTYSALRWALLQLGDRHSGLLDPAAVAALRDAPPPTAPAARLRGQRLAPAIGYLALPAVIGNEAVVADYLAQGQALLGTVGEPPPCGWVLDLRGNGGGNMWPMLAVAGPLLGEGELGAFVDARGTRQPWARRGGQVLLDGAALATLPAPAPAWPLGPVAVLTDGATASSGEAVAVAFRGRPDARSFGAATAGVPTGNHGYPLDDGAILLLTVEPIAAGGVAGDPATDTVLRAALAWLATDRRCGP